MKLMDAFLLARMLLNSLAKRRRTTHFRGTKGEEDNEKIS
jgi:hypothetical protein